MFRKGAEMPSPEGIDIPGIGTVASLPHKRRWFKRHSNDMRIAADGVATVGLLPILTALATRAGITPEFVANTLLITIPTIGFVSDAVDRYLHRGELSIDPPIVEPLKQIEIAQVNRVPTPLQERGGSRAQVLYNAVQTLGHPALVLTAAELLNTRNIAGAVITVGSEIVLLSNTRRQRNIVNSLPK